MPTKLAGTKFTLGDDFRVDRSVVSLASPVSVMAFGAKGDGVTDDTEAIQGALNAGIARVVVPAGTYRVTATLVVPSNLTLSGDGVASVIRLANAANTHLMQNSSYTSGTNDSITIESVCLDGNVANQINNGTQNKHLVRMKTVTRLTIRNCVLRNAGTDCINLIDCDHATIRHNRMHGAYNHAVTFQNCDGLAGEGNYIHDCGSKTDAFGFTSSGHAFIGVNVPCNEVRLVGNYVADMGDSCLRNEAGGEGWVIADNVVVRSGKDSIKIQGLTNDSSRTLTLSSTTNFAQGNTVTGASSGATATITAVGGGTVAVTPTGSYKYFIKYETVTSSGGGSATLNGVSALQAKANIIANNVVIDAGNDGIVAMGVAPCVVSGNVVLRTGINTAGTAAEKWFSSAAGIKVIDNTAGVQITGNHVVGGYASGIALSDADSPVVRGNTCTQCGENGIRLTRCDNATVETNVCFDNSQLVNDTHSGIRIDISGVSSSGWGRHSVRLNRCYNTAASTGQKYGLLLEGGANVTNCRVTHNDMYNQSFSTQALVNWSGSGIVVGQNSGYVTENRGTATIASGQTLVTVTHGLAATPSADQILVTPTNGMGAATKYYIGGIGSTTFNIAVNTDPGANTATFAWQVLS